MLIAKIIYPDSRLIIDIDRKHLFHQLPICSRIRTIHIQWLTSQTRNHSDDVRACWLMDSHGPADVLTIMCDLVSNQSCIPSLPSPILLITGRNRELPSRSPCNNPPQSSAWQSLITSYHHLSKSDRDSISNVHAWSRLMLKNLPVSDQYLPLSPHRFVSVTGVRQSQSCREDGGGG